MVILGWELSQGALWLLGIVGWLVSTLISYRLGLRSASNSRYHEAADRFRTAVHALAHSAPEPGAHSFLTGYGASDKIGPFLTEVQRTVDDFCPFLSARNQEALRSRADELGTFVREKHPRPDSALIMRGGSSTQRQELSEMTKRLAEHAPERY